MTYLEKYEGLNEYQKEAADVVDGPALVLAGAGSGKTLAMTVRIAKLIKEHNVHPSNILSVTFTNKAAGEMRERLDNMIGEENTRGIWMGTFHSMCVRILREDATVLGYKDNGYGQTDFTIYDTEDQKELIDKIYAYRDIPKNMKPEVALSYIDNCKNNLWDPNYAMEFNAEGFTNEMMSLVYSDYQKELLRNNAMDFGDLITNTVYILRSNPHILEKWQRKFKYVLTDEFQDTNYAQFQLLLLLSSPEFNLFVIGDDAQSIYGFRGSDISIILNFQDSFPYAKIINLKMNYRSTNTIVEAGKSLISNNVNQLEKEVESFRGGESPIKVIKTDTEEKESLFIASLIKNRVSKEKNSYKDFSILYRNNFHSRVIEQAMIKAGVPYIVIGGHSFFSREEIKDTLAYVRLVLNSEDDIAFSRIINKPSRKIGEKTVEKLQAFATAQDISLFEAAEKRKFISDLTTRQETSIGGFVSLINEIQELTKNKEKKPSEIIRSVMKISGLDAHYKKHEEHIDKMENLNELVNMFQEIETEDPEKPFYEYLQELSLLSTAAEEEDADVVRLMTIHASKGLEFPVCICPGWCQGVFPSNRSIEDGDIEEERRVAYVAVTRAEDELILTHSKKRRSFKGSLEYVEPSNFLEEIPEDITVSIDMTTN